MIRKMAPARLSNRRPATFAILLTWQLRTVTMPPWSIDISIQESVINPSLLYPKGIQEHRDEANFKCLVFNIMIASLRSWALGSAMTLVFEFFRDSLTLDRKSLLDDRRFFMTCSRGNYLQTENIDICLPSR
jgi:hypothetical protein